MGARKTNWIVLDARPGGEQWPPSPRTTSSTNAYAYEYAHLTRTGRDGILGCRSIGEPGYLSAGD